MFQQQADKKPTCRGTLLRHLNSVTDECRRDCQAAELLNEEVFVTRTNGCRKRRSSLQSTPQLSLLSSHPPVARLSPVLLPASRHRLRAGQRRTRRAASTGRPVSPARRMLRVPSVRAPHIDWRLKALTGALTAGPQWAAPLHLVEGADEQHYYDALKAPHLVEGADEQQ